MLADLRDALRQLQRAPGFTATAVITLALGIGATTAIFTLVQQVMLKSLPVTKPEELWRIGDKIRCCNWGGYIQGDDGDFSLFSWEAYGTFAPIRLSLLTWRHCRPATRRSASVERDHRRRRIHATGSMCREISSGLLGCSRGLGG